MTSDPLERVIRPIVEGQIRSFTHDHPEVVEAVNWYKPRTDKRVTFINSLAKRIVRDLLCPTSRARLAAALTDNGDGESGDVGEPGVDWVTDEAGLALANGLAGDGVEILPAPSLTQGEHRA